MTALSPELEVRIERLLDESVTSARPVSGGYTPAERWLVTLRSGRSAFAKVGTTPMTSSSLRREHEVYCTLQAPCIPRMLGWDDHPDRPLLLIEDLSRAHWPPPWDVDLVAAVRDTLDALHATPTRFARFSELHGSLGSDWDDIAADPAPFLGLGIASERWLSAALPTLIAASANVSYDGEELVHYDVRSDNLCRSAQGIKLIDWNMACRGNGALDLGFWLPSLQAEGGPAPEASLPRRGDIAARVCGYFAARAGLPSIANAPRVRTVQRQQLERALPWACRALGLPPPAAEP